MSGGAFEYHDCNMRDMADIIDDHIRLNGKTVDGLERPAYSPRTLDKFRIASTLLKKCGAMVHRIDWLLSGDDGEDTFEEAWARECQ